MSQSSEYFRICSSLFLKQYNLIKLERLINLSSVKSYYLIFTVNVITREEKKERDSKEKKRKIKRVALIGLATVGGGAILGEQDCER